MNGGVGLLPYNVQLVNDGRQKAIKLVIRIRIRYWDNDKDFKNMNNENFQKKEKR